MGSNKQKYDKSRRLKSWCSYIEDFKGFIEVWVAMGVYILVHDTLGKGQVVAGLMSLFAAVVVDGILKAVVLALSKRSDRLRHESGWGE